MSTREFEGAHVVNQFFRNLDKGQGLGLGSKRLGRGDESVMMQGVISIQFLSKTDRLKEIGLAGVTMSGVPHIEIHESAEELKDLMHQQRQADYRERIQALYINLLNTCDR